MFSIIVKDKSGRASTYTFEDGCGEVSIGRSDDNDIVLPLGNVSQRHSRLRVAGGQFIIQDLDSTNGTFVNRQRVDQAQVLLPSDELRIGHFTLTLQPGVGAMAPVSVPGEAMSRGGIVAGEVSLSLLSVEVEAHVLGPCVSMRLIQRFQNPHKDLPGAVYVLPLEAGMVLGSVGLRLKDRLIESRVQISDDADERPFESQHERPDVLVVGLGRINAGEEVTATVELAMLAPWQGDAWRVAVPASFAQPARRAAQELDSNGLKVTVHVEDATQVTRLGSTSHPWSLQIHNGRWQAQFRQRSPRLDDDLVLLVSPPEGKPAAWITGTAPGPRMAVIHAPAPAPTRRVAREVTFLLDCSNRLQGDAFAKARATLKAALKELGEDDTFNVVWFGNHSSKLWADSVDASPQHRADAERGIERAAATMGEKNLVAALEGALDNPQDPERAWCVVLITDGGARRPNEAIEACRHLGQQARVAILAIHARGNERLLVDMSAAAGGTLTFCDPGDDPSAAASRVMTQTHGPVYQDARVAWGELNVEQAPTVLPMAHAGEALTALACVHDGHADQIMALAGPHAWSIPLRSADEHHHGTIERLWAHALIRDLARHTGQPEAERRAMEISTSYGVPAWNTRLVTASDRPIALTRAWIQWSPARPRPIGGRNVPPLLDPTVGPPLQAPGHHVTAPQPIPTERAPEGLITYQDADGEHREVHISPEFPEITLGRNPGSVIRANQLTVSRAHARFLLVGGTCTLFDLESSHGTFVNEKRITNHILQGGDKIRCGEFELSFDWLRDSQGANALPSEPPTSAPSTHPGADASGAQAALRRRSEEDARKMASLEAEVERYREEQRILIRDLHKAQSALREAPGPERLEELRGELAAMHRERDTFSAFINELRASMTRLDATRSALVSQRPGATPSSQSAQAARAGAMPESTDTEDADWLTGLLATQQPDGSFLMSKDLMRWLGPQTNAIMRAAAVDGEALVVTHVLVSLLTQDVSERAHDWLQAVERANAWISRQGRTIDVNPLLGRR